MSLEVQIAALVAASNTLTGAINGKVSEINAKVKAATDSVPAVVRGLARQIFYIDAVGGDDNNDGATTGSAFKTTAAAQARAVNGGVVELRFKGGQTHYVDFFMELGRIVVSSYDRATEAEEDRPLLIPSGISVNALNERHIRGIGLTSGSIYFGYVNLRCHYDAGGTLEVSSGFIRYTNSNVVIVFRYARIELGNLPLARLYLGYAQRDLGLSAVKLVAMAGYEATARLLWAGDASIKSTLRIELGGTALVNVAGGWPQLLPLRAANNYLTDMGAW